MLPLRLPIQGRRSVSSVRTISLIPPAIFAITVLDYFITDITKGRPKGFEYHNRKGHKVQVFIEVLGFLGYYPASAILIDAIKHSGKAPCSNFPFRHCSKEHEPNFSYTASVHFADCLSLRSMNRTLELRNQALENKIMSSKR